MEKYGKYRLEVVNRLSILCQKDRKPLADILYKDKRAGFSVWYFCQHHCYFSKASFLQLRKHLLLDDDIAAGLLLFFLFLQVQ